MGERTESYVLGRLSVGNSNNKTWDAYVPTYNEDGSVVTTTKPS